MRRSAFGPFTFDVWDPFPHSDLVSETAAISNTRINWKETPEAHVFTMEMPGLRKEEVKVEVEEEGNVLQISWEKRREKEERSDRWHRVERSSGRFMRRFGLPENAKVDKMKVKMESGVLTVTVSKVAVKKSAFKPILITG